jgi:hypothetical protein
MFKNIKLGQRDFQSIVQQFPENKLAVTTSKRHFCFIAHPDVTYRDIATALRDINYASTLSSAPPPAYMQKAVNIVLSTNGILGNDTPVDQYRVFWGEL